MALTKSVSFVSTKSITENSNEAPLKSRQMKIKDKHAQKMLLMLIDLYNNPLMSAIREIISNAIDSYVKMLEENKQAIQVTSPTTDSPFFIVQDFGCGMSTDALYNLYSDGGDSTKEEDFNSIGAYGLGSKSPISYTSSFIVTSIHDGVKSTIEIVRNTEKIDVNLISIEDTNEPNGTTVKIPIKSEDFYRVSQIVRENYGNSIVDVPIILDGEELHNDEQFVYYDDVLLYEDEETGEKYFGQAYFKNDNHYFNDVLRFLPYTTSNKNDYYGLKSSLTSITTHSNVSFSLGGWLYKSLDYRHNGYNNSPSVIIKIQPGIFNFSSSRDEITQNERYNTVIKNINDSLIPHDTESAIKFINNVEKVYSQLKPLIQFSIIQNFLRFGVKKDNNIILMLNKDNNSNAKFILNTELYSYGHNGHNFNPLKEIVSVKKNSIYSAIHFADRLSLKYGMITPNHTNEDKPDLFDGYTTILNYLKEPKQIIDYRSWGDKSNESISSINEKLMDATNNDPEYSLTEYSIMLWNTKNNNNFNIDSITVIRGSNSAFIETFSKRRAVIKRYLTANSFNPLVIFVQDDDTTDEEYLQAFNGFGVITVTNVNDFEAKINEKIEEEKAARRAVVRNEHIIEGKILVKNDETSPKDFLDGFYTQFVHANPNQISLTDVMDNKSIILIAQHNALSASYNNFIKVLYGAMNHGLDMGGERKIILLTNKELRANEYRDLMDYPYAYIEPSVTINSKILGDFMARHRSYDERPNLFNEEASLYEVIYSYMSEKYNLNPYLVYMRAEPVLNILGAVSSNPYFVSFCQEMSQGIKDNTKIKYHTDVNVSIIDELVSKGMSEESAKIIETILSNIPSLSQFDVLFKKDSSLISSVLGFSYAYRNDPIIVGAKYDLTPIKSEIIKMLTNIVDDKLTELHDNNVEEGFSFGIIE